jgi:adenosylcobinamide-phosphate synthase
VVYFLSDFAIRLTGKVGGWGSWAATVYLAFTVLAAGSLRSEALGVGAEIERGKLPEARRKLARIVGRKTDDLKEEGVIRGAVESVAENASDGVIAPLFYLLIGGVPLALAYKAINTLDSMVGYKDERYLRFGWASARLDDLANLVPSRLTALLIVIVSPALGEDASKAWRIFRRDGGNDDSPNSGQPEAAMAGALRIGLGGPVEYETGWVAKPAIGDPERPLDAGVLRRAVGLMEGAALLMVLLSAGLMWIRK